MDASNGRKTLTVEAGLHRKLKAMSKTTGVKIAALVDQLLATALKVESRKSA